MTRILCAHADADGQGAHWIEEWEVCGGCACGHGSYHHRAGRWPHGPIDGPCAERGCACEHFDRGYICGAKQRRVKEHG